VQDIVNAFVFVFASLFPIVNPIGAAPIFLSITAGQSQARRSRLALSAAFNSFWLLLAATLFGSVVLEFFGITVPVVRVAGGLLVTAMGWKLLNEGDTSAAGKEQVTLTEDGFYPLTLPLTVGPGAISVALTIGSHHPADKFTVHTMFLAGAAVLGLLAIAVTVWASYRFAARLVRYLGQTGVNVLVRLSAFILVCIGVQILWGGVSALVVGLRGPLASF
jgi:multiple antibiotic resistance protein